MLRLFAVVFLLLSLSALANSQSSGVSASEASASEVVASSGGVAASASGAVAASASGAAAASASGAAAASASGAAAASASGAAAASASGAVAASSGAVAASASGAVAASSGAVAASVGASAAATVGTLPAPTNVINLCENKIINICPYWTASSIYVSFTVTFTAAGGSPNTFVTTETSGKITNLMPATAYTITVVGQTNTGEFSAPSAPVTFTTAAQDPKLDPSLDISNIVCVPGQSTATPSRGVINCTWNAAQETLTRLVIKWRCVAPNRKNRSNKKRLYGTRAQGTSVTLNVNRNFGTCNVFFRSYFARRPTNRVSLTVNLA